MLIEKPRCCFKNCRYCFDGNCYSADKYENCTLTDLHYEIAKLTVDRDNAKSEVDRLQEEANRYKRYFFHHDYDEMIAEVLDKLDRFINANCIEIKDERGIKGYVTSGVHFAIAELKKKYTEEKE